MEASVPDSWNRESLHCEINNDLTNVQSPYLVVLSTGVTRGTIGGGDLGSHVHLEYHVYSTPLLVHDLRKRQQKSRLVSSQAIYRSYRH